MTRLTTPAAALAAASLVLAAAACGGAPGEDGDAAEPEPHGSWQLVSGSGPEGAVEAPESHPITLVFEEDDRVGGRAACNAYGASANVDGDRLELRELAQTEMACEPAAVMEAEAAYLAALQRVERFRRDGGRLVLEGDGVELVFEELPPASTEALVGTAWELDTIVGDDGTASTPPSSATLLLGAGGTLEGHTGCRELTGEYELQGNEVRATRLELHGDVETCAPEAAEQDALVVEVLGDGFGAEVEGERLTLSSSQGGAGLVYRAVGGG